MVRSVSGKILCAMTESPLPNSNTSGISIVSFVVVLVLRAEGTVQDDCRHNEQRQQRCQQSRRN